MTAFAARRKVRNLNSPLDGVLNSRADVANLYRLRQHGVTNLAAPDQLEATPVFSSGKADSAGITVNRVLSRPCKTHLTRLTDDCGDAPLVRSGV